MTELKQQPVSVWERLGRAWPLLMTFAVFVIYYVRSDEKLLQTADLARETARKVSVLEQTVAVQTAILTEIKDTVREISRRQRRD